MNRYIFDYAESVNNLDLEQSFRLAQPGGASWSNGGDSTGASRVKTLCDGPGGRSHRSRTGRLKLGTRAAGVSLLQGTAGSAGVACALWSFTSDGAAAEFAGVEVRRRRACAVARRPTCRRPRFAARSSAGSRHRFGSTAIEVIYSAHADPVARRLFNVGIRVACLRWRHHPSTRYRLSSCSTSPTRKSTYANRGQ